jgi:hypothetical protein
VLHFAKCLILRTFLTHESWFLLLPFWCVIDFLLQMWHHYHGLCKWRDFGKDTVVSTNGKLAPCFLNIHVSQFQSWTKMSSKYKIITPACMLELSNSGKEWEGYKDSSLWDSYHQLPFHSTERWVQVLVHIMVQRPKNYKSTDSFLDITFVPKPWNSLSQIWGGYDQRTNEKCRIIRVVHLDKLIWHVKLSCTLDETQLTLSLDHIA